MIVGATFAAAQIAGKVVNVVKELARDHKTPGGDLRMAKALASLASPSPGSLDPGSLATAGGESSVSSGRLLDIGTALGETEKTASSDLRLAGALERLAASIPGAFGGTDAASGAEQASASPGHATEVGTTSGRNGVSSDVGQEPGRALSESDRPAPQDLDVGRIAPLGEAAPPTSELSKGPFEVGQIKPVGRDEVDQARLRLRESDLAGPLQTFDRQLSHLPNYEPQLVHLDRVTDSHRHRSGTLGELDTSTRLEKQGTRVHDINRQIYVRGVRFTDIDVLTKAGTIVEVRNWSDQQLCLSAAKAKYERLNSLVQAGTVVDGLRTRRIAFVTNAGGISSAAEDFLVSKGVVVVNGYRDYSKIL